MVDRLDDGAIDAELGPLDYKGLYKAICSRIFFFFLKSDIQVLVIYLSLLTLEVVFRLLEELSLGHMLKVNLRYI
jgi:hypothetical protein